MRLVRIAEEEENVALADRAREEDRGSSEEEGALRSESVVGDDELGLASVECDGTGGLGKGEGAFGGGEGEGEGDVVPA